MAAEVSKVIGYATVRPPDDHVTVSKVLGYVILRPDDGLVAVSKLVGYAVLRPGEEPEPEPPTARRGRMPIFFGW